MITSRSGYDWAAIESRQSARSSALLKNATTTLIRGLVTGLVPWLIVGGSSSGARHRGSSSGGRAAYGLPAECHRVVGPLHVDLVPEREHDKQPYLPPGHVRIVGPEAAQDIQRGALVQPLAGLRRVDRLLRETIHAAAQPRAERHREAELGPLGGGLGQQVGDGFPERELGGAGGGLLHPGQPRRHREDLAVKERRAQLRS